MQRDRHTHKAPLLMVFLCYLHSKGIITIKLMKTSEEEPNHENYIYKSEAQRKTGIRISCFSFVIGYRVNDAAIFTGTNDKQRSNCKFQEDDMGSRWDYGCDYCVLLPDQCGFCQNRIRNFCGFWGKTAGRSV